MVPSWISKPETLEEVATKALTSLTDALQPESPDPAKLQSCFLGTQAYWRDLLALTYHFRTLKDGSIAPAMVKLKKKRGLVGRFDMVPETVGFVEVNPRLRWIHCMFTFKTVNPAAECGGRMVLLPDIMDGQDESSKNSFDWKIWSLSTWLNGYEDFPENVDLLTGPGRRLDDLETIETSTFIIGGGNAGIILSARLKALGVESVILDRNPRPGDNWALRYDCMRFHIAKSNCETPYLRKSRLSTVRHFCPFQYL